MLSSLTSEDKKNTTQKKHWTFNYILSKATFQTVELFFHQGLREEERKNSYIYIFRI